MLIADSDIIGSNSNSILLWDSYFEWYLSTIGAGIFLEQTSLTLFPFHKVRKLTFRTYPI